MNAYTIPVAVVVIAETEAEAAKIVAQALAKADIVGLASDSPHEPIDSWFTPNHPEADGSDGDARLVWAD